MTRLCVLRPCLLHLRCLMLAVVGCIWFSCQMLLHDPATAVLSNSASGQRRKEPAPILLQINKFQSRRASSSACAQPLRAAREQQLVAARAQPSTRGPVNSTTPPINSLLTHSSASIIHHRCTNPAPCRPPTNSLADCILDANFRASNLSCCIWPPPPLQLQPALILQQRVCSVRCLASWRPTGTHAHFDWRPKKWFYRAGVCERMHTCACLHRSKTAMIAAIREVHHGRASLWS